MESKELKNIIKSINEYREKHKNDVSIICSVMAFKGKDCEVVDDRVLVFGLKESLKEDLKGLNEEIDKEKEDIVCW